MKLRALVVIGTALSLVSACQPQGPYSSGMGGGGSQVSKADIGTIAGGLGGAFAGSNLGKGSGKTVGIAAGTLLGAFIGNQIGTSLDRADAMYAERTAQNTLESARIGQSQRWSNPDSGNYGTITPTRTFQKSDGSFCREFSQTIVVGGRNQEAFGTACRQSDGSWKIVS